jgi:glyoxylase-like metal-dependent hydrolase (beta-lactamase superfamily II)
MRALAAAGVSVEEIDFVMCTHLHPDHVGWNTRSQNGRWVPTFPNARYVFSRKEYDYWAEQHAKNRIETIADSVLPIIEAKKANLVSSEHALDDHVRLMPTPGHTVDHFSVCFGRGSDAAVMPGDVLHTPLQARYPELSPGDHGLKQAAGSPLSGEYDSKQSAVTRRSFLERYCDTDTLCCTAHFPSPSVGHHIKRWGDGFHCEPLND